MATSKTAGVIFHLSLTLDLSALSLLHPCGAAHFRDRIYKRLFSFSLFFFLSFLLFSFPNEPRNANGITTHPRSHDSFYIHDETFAHAKARGLNAGFSCSCRREIHADCFSENSAAEGVKL